MEKLTVVKVGGAVVEEQRQLVGLLRNFVEMPGKKVLVHGGGRRATKVAAALGIESEMLNGRRITGKAMLEVVTMVYGGLVNKNIVALLNALGTNAVGLTGADMGIIKADKRPPVTLDNGKGELQTVDFGYVGDVKKVDGQALSSLVNQNITPIIAPLSFDGQGSLLNTNADTIASSVAVALSAFYDTTLVFAFEKRGVLANEDDEQSVIPVITREDYARYSADGTIKGGMLPKIENALDAVSKGVKQVKITCVGNLSGGTTVK